MSHRGQPQNLEEHLQDILDRLRRLERGDQNRGRVSFTETQFGKDLVISEVTVGGQTYLQVTRKSDGETCLIGPPDCGGGGIGALEADFSISGAVIPAGSPLWFAPQDCELTEVLASTQVAGTTDTLVHVYLNGFDVGTVTVPAGTRSVVTEGWKRKMRKNTDYLQVRVLTAGAGAQDLVVQARFSRVQPDADEPPAVPPILIGPVVH